jgi:hypothetical protein
MKRGQTSLEFLFLIGFMFAIFTVFFIVIQERTADISREKDYASMKEINNLVKYEIKNAQFFNNGYKRSFWVSPRIYGRTYAVNISDDHAEAYYNLTGVEYIDFFDNPTYGTILLGMNDICKKEDGVYLNDCSGVLAESS